MAFFTAPTQDLMVPDNDLEVQIAESQSKEQPDEVWTSAIKRLLNNKRSSLDDPTKDNPIIPAQVIS